MLAVCEDLATRARGYETTTPVDVIEDVSLLGDAHRERRRRGLALAIFRSTACSSCTSAISSTIKASTCCSTRIATLDTATPLKVVAIGGYSGRRRRVPTARGHARHQRYSDVHGRTAAQGARRVPRASRRARVAALERPEHADEAVLVSRGGQGRARDPHPLAHPGSDRRLRAARRADGGRRSPTVSTPCCARLRYASSSAAPHAVWRRHAIRLPSFARRSRTRTGGLRLLLRATHDDDHFERTRCNDESVGHGRNRLYWHGSGPPAAVRRSLRRSAGLQGRPGRERAQTPRRGSDIGLGHGPRRRHARDAAASTSCTTWLRHFASSTCRSGTTTRSTSRARATC